MKRAMYFLGGSFLVLVSALSVASYGNAPQQLSELSTTVNAQLQSIERNITALANAMPESKFDFTPESLHINGSVFDGVRTFAAQIKHLATDNYDMFCAITHDPVPPGIIGVEGPADIKSKADIMKYLKGSFDEGRKAIEGLNPENAKDPIEFRGQKMPRITLIYYALFHTNDHYGQMVVYARMCGITPGMARNMNS